MNTVKDKVKAERLNHYQDRDPHAFAQFDGFSGVLVDDMMNPDQDGDSVCSGTTYELMTGLPAVRVLITAGTNEKTALRLLRKIRGWVKAGGLKRYRAELDSMQDKLNEEICPRCNRKSSQGHSPFCGVASLTNEQVREVIEAYKYQEIPF